MRKVPIRPNVKQIPVYVPGKRSDAGPLTYKLSSNELPFPPLPGVLAAVSDAAAEVNRYPNAFSTDLIRALADFHQVDSEQVVVGAGSLAVLGHMLAAVAGPGDQVLYPWRSFEAYPLLTAVAAATAVTVPLSPDGALDLDALARAITPATRVVMVCTPNNPTGPAVGRDQFEAFMDRVPGDVLVAVDNAYAEFVDDPAALDPFAVLPDHPNLLVFRTFSKAYGLAGLRVGYAVGRARLIGAMRATTPPFSVSAVAQLAGLVSLGLQDQMRQRVAETNEVRRQLRQGLLDQGWQVPDSQGNFVWIPAGTQAGPLADALAAAGLMARAFANEGVRVTAAEPETVPHVLELTKSWV